MGALKWVAWHGATTTPQSGVEEVHKDGEGTQTRNNNKKYTYIYVGGENPSVNPPKCKWFCVCGRTAGGKKEIVEANMLMGMKGGGGDPAQYTIGLRR